MARAFKRKYELVIYRPALTKSSVNLPQTQAQLRQFFGNPKNVDEFLQDLTVIQGDIITTIPDAQITVTELDIIATLGSNKSSSSSSGGKGDSLTIVNASETTQSFIKANYHVILRAGYESEPDLPIIYVGHVSSVYTEKKGQDTHTVISLKDGGNISETFNVSKSFPRGTLYKDVFDFFINAYAQAGMPLGSFVETGVSDAVGFGLAFEGKLQENFDKFCASVGFRNYTDLGKIYIEPLQLTDPTLKNSQLRRVTITEEQTKGGIRPASGNKKDKSNPDAGVMVSTFMNGSIKLASILNIPFGRHAGDYKIQSISHELHYRGKSWDTIVTAQNIDTDNRA